MRSRALWLLGGLFAVAAWLAVVDGRTDVGDAALFAEAGRTLFSGHWLDTFARADLQAGPLQMAAFGAVSQLSSALDVSQFRLLAPLIELGSLAALVALAGRVAEPGRRGAVRVAVGAAALAIGLVRGAFLDGHPGEVLIPLVWVLAAQRAQRGQGARAGLLVGLSAGLELWGLLGLPVLLLARPRRALAGMAAATVAAAALFAPFMLFGRFGMFAYHWQISDGTLLHLFFSYGTPFGWQLRVGQAAAAVTAGAVVTWFARGSRHAIWAVPLATVGVRIVLDPAYNPWYWQAPQTLALLGAAAYCSRLPIRGYRTRPARSMT